MFPETRQATYLSSLPVLFRPEGPLTTPQDALIPVGSPIKFNSFINMSTQTLQEQMPYTTDINRAFDLGNTGPGLVPALDLPRHILNAIDSSGLSEDAGGFMNGPGRMMSVDLSSAWANPPSFHGNAIAEEGGTNTSDVPACNGLNVTTSSLRLRGVRSPPQTYEDDVGKLFDRLIREGADIGAAMFLRYVIFAEGVTLDALMAPIQVREVFRACDGASKMWKVLLETKGVVPGKEKYCCLLCPVGNRVEYRHDHDAVRHFNRDHFGFSFPCEYW